MANHINLSHADIAKLIEASDSKEEVSKYENHTSDEIESKSSDNEIDKDLQQINYKESIQSKNCEIKWSEWNENKLTTQRLILQGLGKLFIFLHIETRAQLSRCEDSIKIMKGIQRKKEKVPSENTSFCVCNQEKTHLEEPSRKDLLRILHCVSNVQALLIKIW
ncbi:hypothetical protein TNCV_293611 [Trichonephila clavipes]|nr:hypothetical protein TNCV_293611 [Trichonephila clavipes]